MAGLGHHLGGPDSHRRAATGLQCRARSAGGGRGGDRLAPWSKDAGGDLPRGHAGVPRVSPVDGERGERPEARRAGVSVRLPPGRHGPRPLVAVAFPRGDDRGRRAAGDLRELSVWAGECGPRRPRTTTSIRAGGDGTAIRRPSTCIASRLRRIGLFGERRGRWHAAGTMPTDGRSRLSIHHAHEPLSCVFDSCVAAVRKDQWQVVTTPKSLDGMTIIERYGDLRMKLTLENVSVIHAAEGSDLARTSGRGGRGLRADRGGQLREPVIRRFVTGP